MKEEGNWSEKFGDRRSELVCIGVKLEKEKMMAALKSCLMTDEEMDSESAWQEIILGGTGFKGLNFGRCAFDGKPLWDLEDLMVYLIGKLKGMFTKWEEGDLEPGEMEDDTECVMDERFRNLKLGPDLDQDDESSEDEESSEEDDSSSKEETSSEESSEDEENKNDESDVDYNDFAKKVIEKLEEAKQRELINN